MSPDWDALVQLLYLELFRLIEAGAAEVQAECLADEIWPLIVQAREDGIAEGRRLERESSQRK